MTDKEKKLSSDLIKVEEDKKRNELTRQKSIQVEKDQKEQQDFYGNVTGFGGIDVFALAGLLGGFGNQMPKDPDTIDVDYTDVTDITDESDETKLLE